MAGYVVLYDENRLFDPMLKKIMLFFYNFRPK